MIGTSRKTVTLPSAGVFSEVPVAGYQVIIEKSPDNDPTSVPVLRINSRGGAEFPCYTGALYKFPEGFDRVFIEGTSATGDLYVLIINSLGVEVEFPATVT